MRAEVPGCLARARSSTTPRKAARSGEIVPCHASPVPTFRCLPPFGFRERQRITRNYSGDAGSALAPVVENLARTQGLLRGCSSRMRNLRIRRGLARTGMGSDGDGALACPCPVSNSHRAIQDNIAAFVHRIDHDGTIAN